MELRQLTYFLAAAQTQNFGQAANICLIAQSNLSRQIIALEKELNVELFKRVNKRVILTTAGQEFAAYARNALDELQKGQQAMVELAAGEKGLILIGCIETLASTFLPGLLIEFSQQYPKIELKIIAGRTDELLKAVEQGSLDLALVFDPGTRSELLIIKELFRQNLNLVVPFNHRFSRQNRQTGVTLREIMEEPLLLLSERSRLRRTIDRLIAQRGYLIKPRVEIDSIEGLLELLKQNLGVTLLLPLIIRPDQIEHHLEIIPIVDLTEEFIFALIYRRVGTISRPARALLKMINVRSMTNFS